MVEVFIIIYYLLGQLARSRCELQAVESWFIQKGLSSILSTQFPAQSAINCRTLSVLQINKIFVISQKQIKPHSTALKTQTMLCVEKITKPVGAR